MNGDVTRTSNALAVAFLLLVAACSYGWHLEKPGYHKSDELFYMTGALTATETQDWLIPVYEDAPRLKKPPLQYWLIAMSYRAFGVGVAQARLPSALAGLGCLLLTYGLGRLLFHSRRTALFAMGVLLSSELFLRQAHVAITDAVLAFLILLAFHGWAAAWRGRPWGSLVAWIALGGAMLQKGPVGLALPLSGLLLWLVVQERAQRPPWRTFFPGAGLLLFFLIILPWPLLVYQRLGWAGFLGPVQEEVGFHLRLNALRTVSSLFRYATDVLRAVLPWSLLLVFVRPPTWKSREMRFLACWVGVTIVIFSFAVLKQRWRYMVPAMPAMALLLGHLLQAAEQRLAARFRSWPGPAVSLWGLLSVSAGLALLHVQTAVTPKALQAPHAAFALARQYLAVPADGSVTLGLEGHDRCWAWMGAGRSLPRRESAEVNPARDAVVLADAKAWEQVAGDVRSRYRLRAQRTSGEVSNKGREPGSAITCVLLSLEPDLLGR